MRPDLRITLVYWTMNVGASLTTGYVYTSAPPNHFNPNIP